MSELQPDIRKEDMVGNFDIEEVCLRVQHRFELLVNTYFLQSLVHKLGIYVLRIGSKARQQTIRLLFCLFCPHWHFSPLHRRVGLVEDFFPKLAEAERPTGGTEMRLVSWSVGQGVF